MGVSSTPLYKQDVTIVPVVKTEETPDLDHLFKPIEDEKTVSKNVFEAVVL